MNSNPLYKGMIEANSVGIGQISTQMIEKRAADLALIAGRPVTPQDDEQALRELTGGDDLDANQISLESIPEERRWAPVPGSSGHQVEEYLSDDEDEDGQGASAQLYEEGIKEAAHDQMLQAAIAAADLSPPDEHPQQHE